MKRLLTYGLLLLTILASHFVVSACQDDMPDTTEVMMTFTTRALVSDIISSDAPNEDKMQDLRVIMLREDGTVVDNHLEKGINASSVTFTFTTPIQTGGEDFTFLAVANEKSIQSSSAFTWISCLPGDNLSSSLSAIKAQQIGDGEAFNISDGPIPQTKQWTVTVPQQDTHVENQQLDFVASKISVQFINNTNKAQSLSNIYITGIGSNVYGYLFAQNSNDYIDTQHDESNITFNAVSNLAVSATSDIQTYYTYPVGSVSEPTLHATWNNTEYTLPIKINDAFITSLKRNDHLQIVVTLTGQELTVNYTIAEWNTDNATNIGSPTPEGGYQVGDWSDGNDVIIGGEIGGGEEPEEPEEPGGNEPGGETPIGGSILWSGTETLKWSDLPIYCEKFNDLAYDVTTSHKIRISFNSPTNNATLQLKYGVSNVNFAVPELGGSNSATIKNGTTSFDFTLTQEMLDNFLNKENSTVAFYVRSDVLTITEVLLYLPETQ